MEEHTIKLGGLERCPTHQSPLKMGKVEDFTIVWCSDCVKNIRRQPKDKSAKLWASCHVWPIIEVKHEKQD